MPYIVVPTYNPTSAYRPIIWHTFAISPDPVEVAVCGVYVGGVFQAFMYLSPFLNVGNNYFFRFDVQSIMQNFLAPKAQQKTTVFGTLGAQYSALNPDCFDDVSLEVTYLYRDPTTNKLVDLGISDASTVDDVVLMTRQHQQDQDPSNYVAGFGLGAPFLTNAPDGQEICLDESLFISLLPGGANAFQVRTFDSAGAQVDVGIFSAPVNSGNDQASFGIGCNEIRNTTFDLFGSVNIDNPAVAYYQIVAGAYGAPFFFFYTEVRRYYISECCDDSVRLHFLNLLGGADAYTFKSKAVRSISANSDLAQKPLGYDITQFTPHSIEDKGGFKLNVDAVESYQLESQYLDIESANWLSELLVSAEVYEETANGLVPVIVSDVTQDLETNDSNGVQLVRFNITVLKANSIIAHRN